MLFPPNLLSGTKLVFALYLQRKLCCKQHVFPSICLSVGLSVAAQHRIKTAKHIIEVLSRLLAPQNWTMFWNSNGVFLSYYVAHPRRPH